MLVPFPWMDTTIRFSSRPTCKRERERELLHVHVPYPLGWISTTSLHRFLSFQTKVQSNPYNGRMHPSWSRDVKSRMRFRWLRNAWFWRTKKTIAILSLFPRRRHANANGSETYIEKSMLLAWFPDHRADEIVSILRSSMKRNVSNSLPYAMHFEKEPENPPSVLPVTPTKRGGMGSLSSNLALACGDVDESNNKSCRKRFVRSISIVTCVKTKGEEKRNSVSRMQSTSRVLLVGGDGAVGRQMVRSWSLANGRGEPVPRLRVAGRRTLRDPKGSFEFEFVDLDASDAKEQLRKVADGADVVVHLAGPFLPKDFNRMRKMNETEEEQGSKEGFMLDEEISKKLSVVEVALDMGAHYVDACPHPFFYKEVKKCFESQAQRNGLVAVVGGCISPGVSGLLTRLGASKGGTMTKIARTMRANGGLGRAHLADTIAEHATRDLEISDTERTKKVKVDFGDGFGKVSLEAFKENDYSGNASLPWSLFLNQASSRVLQHMDLASCLTEASNGMNIASASDFIFGKGYAIRVDSIVPGNGQDRNEKRICSRVVYGDASRFAADSLIAYATFLSSESVEPGVWWGDEAVDDEHIRAVLQMATKNARMCDLLVSPWRMASTPRELGLGIYIE